MADIIEFPSDVSGMIETIRDMYRDGTIRELILFAPNAKDSRVYHFRASDGIKLSDVLMAKQELTMNADALCRGDKKHGEAL